MLTFIDAETNREFVPDNQSELTTDNPLTLQEEAVKFEGKVGRIKTWAMSGLDLTVTVVF